MAQIPFNLKVKLFDIRQDHFTMHQKLKVQEGSSSSVIFFISRVDMLFYYALLL